MCLDYWPHVHNRDRAMLRAGSRMEQSLRPSVCRVVVFRDRRGRSIVEIGRAVVGQALEIAPDQSFVRSWTSPALATIQLSGQKNDQFSITTLFCHAKVLQDRSLEKQLGVVGR